MSSDSVEFRLHRLYLSHASPYFRMLLSNQPPRTPENALSLPITLDETSRNFYMLLQYVYPTPLRPPVKSLDDAVPLYAAATKLQIEVAVPLILSDLTRLLNETANPFRAWAIAVRLQLDGPRTAAMERLSRLDPFGSSSLLAEDIQELTYVTGLQLSVLLGWVTTETAYAGSIVPRAVRRWIPGAGGVDASSVPTIPASDDSSMEGRVVAPAVDPLSFPDGDLVVEAIDGVRFRLHALFLSHASVYLAEEIKKRSSGDLHLPLLPRVPLVTIAENSQILDILFRHIYPSPRKSLLDQLDVVVDVLNAARRLKIDVMVPVALEALVRVLNVVQNPLRAWAVAVRADASEAQLQSLRRFLQLSEASAVRHIAENAQELRYTTGAQLRKVLEWRKTWAESARVVLQHDWSITCSSRYGRARTPAAAALVQEEINLLHCQGLWNNAVLSDAAFNKYGRKRCHFGGCDVHGSNSPIPTASDLRYKMTTLLTQALGQ